MKTRIFFLALIFLANISFAQDEMFKVLASKGTNKIASGTSTDWRSLKIGEKINKTDKITVGEGGYLGLAHKSGKTIEIKKAGTYTAESLSSQVAAQNAGMGKKYVDFMVGEMTAKNEDMASNRHKYMDVTGSVERGGNDIHAFVPKEAFFLNNKNLVKWQPVKGVKTYVVKVTNMFDEPVFKIETTESSAIIDLSKIDMNDDKQVYILSISSKENPNLKSDEYALKHLSKDKTTIVNQQSTELNKEFSDESALNKVVMASFYEENKLILNAVENYESAIKLEPGVDDYQVAYGRFLQRNNLAEIK
ncbi:MAG TPA: hypothetical protein VNW99_00300 [Cytophagaceae bacterium]|jgi:hypothetical protein|nr:hypothetical protein [Cytophagaceae bacterium]